MRMKAQFCLAVMLTCVISTTECIEPGFALVSADLSIQPLSILSSSSLDATRSYNSSIEDNSSDSQQERSHSWPVELLRRIPGPKFLLLFLCLSVICILIAWLWKNTDGTGFDPLPELTRLELYATATLRGGSKAVIQTAVLSLWNKNLIKLKSEDQWSMHDDIDAETEGPQEILLHPIEAEVLDFLQTSRRPSELLKSLRPRLRQHMQPIYTELEDLHLIRTARQQTKVWLVTVMMVSVILMVGGMKLYLGTIYKKPVGFLVLLLPGALIALFMIVKPWIRLTKLADRYQKTLERVQLATKYY